MNSIRLASILRPASILWIAGMAAASPIYNVVDLGSLGGANAAAFGLSSNGIVVGVATTSTGYNHALTSSGTFMTDLTLNSTAAEGMAYAVNSKGQVAGTEYVNGEAFATIWMDGVTRAIAAAGSFAMGINDSGDIAGMLTSGGQGHAFVTQNGNIVDLGTPAGASWASAYGINNAGQVAGYSETVTGSFRGFVWSPEAGYTVLGTLGGGNGYAMAINASGDAAGSAQTPSGYSHAFRESGGVLTDLGTLGGNSSFGYAIDSKGDVAGYSLISGNNATHAFLFENGVLLDLNSLTAAPGWVLTEAYAINDRGEIAGAGFLNGVGHAFLLEQGVELAGGGSTQTFSGTVPEPSPLLLLVGGLGLIALSRLRLARRHRVRPRAPRQ